MKGCLQGSRRMLTVSFSVQSILKDKEDDCDTMLKIFDSLRELTFHSICLRLLLAAVTGGLIGYGRTRKKRAAGMRTYMITSLGSALTIVLSLFEYEMLQTIWADSALLAGGLKIDVSRYGAQVIAGIGFLTAGTILASAHHQVSGLTTAVGLFGSACIGLACGAGFFELVCVSALLLIFFLEVLPPMELAFRSKKHNVTLYVECYNIADVAKICDLITCHQARVFDIDIEHPGSKNDVLPGAIIDVHLNRDNYSLSELYSSVAEMDCVHYVQELIQ